SDKASVVADVVKEKPADVIKNESDKVSVVAAVVNEKPTDVIEKRLLMCLMRRILKISKKTGKPTDRVSKGKALDILKYKCKTELPKDNQKDNTKDKVPVVKESDKALADNADVGKALVKDKIKTTVKRQDDLAKVVKENVLAVVNDKASNVLKNKGKKSAVGKDKGLRDIPKDKPKNNAPDVVKEKSKLNPKQKVISSEIPVLRSKEKAKPKVKAKPNPKQKVKPEVKAKTDVRILRSEEKVVTRKRNLLKEDDNKRKVNVKLLKGRSKKEDSDSELETDEIVSSSDEVDHKPKKMKLKDSRVDMLNFLLERGFSSLHNVTIDKIPSKLGRFVVENFNEETYMLSLDSGDRERQVDHEFLRLWVGQFHPKPLKDIQVNDIASKLVVAQEVNFLFKVNFVTLFTSTMGMSDGLKGQICLDVVRRLRKDSVISDIDWCGYIYDCLQHSKLSLGTNHYLGPLTFLILLYLDSTKFDRFLVVCTRPQQHELELKNHVLGVLELHGEWTEAEGQETKGFMGDSETSKKEASEEKLSLICAKKVMLKEYLRKASLDYTSDGKFLDLHEKYVQLFKDPISFNDDGNGDNDSDDDANDGDGNRDNDSDDDANDDDGNGDDDTGNGDDDDGNEDDDAGVDDDVNEDDDDNVDDNGGSKKQVESMEKQSVDPTDPFGEENVFEEENDITCTPESYTQWLDENADFILE
nr:hypothetical protein [Tanacetum cinerariifolium]